MNKEREEFEKLPEIAEKIKRSRLNFSKILNRYLTSTMSDDDQFDCDFVNGAWYSYQEQQKNIDAHNEKLSLFINELKKTHREDIDNKMDYWRGFSDCAEATVKVFYRDVGVVTCKE